MGDHFAAFSFVEQEKKEPEKKEPEKKDAAGKDAPKSVKANVRYGSSPRGAQAILMCAKVRALAAGRFHVALEDVKKAAVPALRHRLILNFEGEASGIGTDRLVEEILAHVETPQK